MNLAAARDREPDPILGRHRGEFVRIRPAPGIAAEQHALAAGIEAGARIRDLTDGKVCVGDPAEDALVLFPKTAAELQSRLDHGRIGNGVDGGFHRSGDVDGKLTQDRERQSANAPVGPRLLDHCATAEIFERDGHAVLVLMDRRDFASVPDCVWDLPGERLADPTHAADRLEHRRLEVVEGKVLQAAPKAGRQEIMQLNGLAVQRLPGQTAAGVPGVASERRRHVARLVTKVVVKRAEGTQRFEEDLLVFFGDCFVKRALMGRLGQKFGNRALEVGLDLANPLRLPPESRGRMKVGVVIELNERLDRNAEPAAVIENGVVVVRDPPWPRIEIEAVVEQAPLRGAAELGVRIAAPDRPVSTAGATVVFQDVDLVAGLAEFERSRHSGKPGAQDDDRRARRIALELDRAPIGRLRSDPQARHRLIHRGTASGCPDQRQEIAAPRLGARRFIHGVCHDFEMVLLKACGTAAATICYPNPMVQHDAEAMRKRARF